MTKQQLLKEAKILESKLANVKQQIAKEETLRMQMLAGVITEGQYKKRLNENSSEDIEQLLQDAGLDFSDGILGDVGSGGGGYYDNISDKISGFNLDKFDKNEFNKWYDNFLSKANFNKIEYKNEDAAEEEMDFSGLPKGIHQTEGGAVEVNDGGIILYAYPVLSNDDEMIEIFKLDKNGRVVKNLSKEEVMRNLMNNEYSII